MRVYGPNVYELVLVDLLAVVGLTLIGWTTAVTLAPDSLAAAATTTGGLLAGATGVTGAALILAGTGVRQNRAALDLGQGMLFACGLAWLSWSMVAGRTVGVIAGAVLVGAAVLVWLLRRAAVTERFRPRFFSPRQFETLVAIADTMIDGDGRAVVDPIRVAVNVDHMLAETDGPTPGQIKLVVTVVEWLLPLLLARPVPFSSLGSGVRRRVIGRVIGSGGLFRAVARTLKALTSYGYYGNADTMRLMGYVAFEDRPRAITLDQAPATYPDPFAKVEQ